MDEADHPYRHCLFFSTNALARALTRVAEEAFAPTGLAPSLAFTMMTVKRRPGVQPSEIANIMRISPSTVTRFVDGLEAKGLLRRTSDGKASLIRLSEEGERLVPGLFDAWETARGRFCAALGGEDVDALAEKLFHSALSIDDR